jgi:hypothetical protein
MIAINTPAPAEANSAPAVRRSRSFVAGRSMWTSSSNSRSKTVVIVVTLLVVDLPRP